MLYCIINYRKKQVMAMALKLHDIVIMKKAHPCGCSEFEITRLGVDYKLKCTRCGREVLLPRIKAEKNIKSVKDTL